MIPTELDAETLPLPETDDYSIVLITSNGLRHQRFALRVIEEFGDLVSAWYECDAGVEPRFAGPPKPGAAPQGLKAKALQFARDGIPYARSTGTVDRLVAVMRMLRFRWQWRRHLDGYAAAEQRLFAAEVARLRTATGREPIRVNPRDINTDGFVAEVRERDPFFLLTLAGPLYREQILSTPRGVPLNQHAGHSPDLKGSNTIEWALFRHQLDRVSNTVHVTTTGADSGPILRRSSPCLMPGDDPATAFCRVVATGTELMIEAVRDIMNTGTCTVYPQPPTAGVTYLGTDVTPAMLDALRRDTRAGWMQDELRRLQNW